MISDNALTIIVTAVCTAIPLTIVAWRQNVKTADKIDANTTLTKEVRDKTDHIVTLTNSSLTEVKTELKAANVQIKDLQSLVKSLAERNGRVDGSHK